MKRRLIYCYVRLVLFVFIVCPERRRERRLLRLIKWKARRLRKFGRRLGFTEEDTIRHCYELDMRQRGMR